MTIRQKLLQAIYPLYSRLSRLLARNVLVLHHEQHDTPISFYSLQAELCSGKDMDMQSLKGKKVLLVNTASDCGFTPQYKQLQQLYQQYQDKLVVLAFPSNDFKQEGEDDAVIALFCSTGFGVRFPLMKKSVVRKNSEQGQVFQWLTQPSKNGWNSQAPSWNFSKYLVNETGTLVGYFGPAIDPFGETIRKAVEKE